MSRRQRWRRGFNQAERIAATLAAALGIEHVEGALCKVARTRRQSQTPRDARADNVRGAFAAVDTRLAGLRVILVDDLVTTGATAGACASAILAAGAKVVAVVCFARAL
jgi:predicted amidophosphoribosyltransferase